MTVIGMAFSLAVRRVVVAEFDGSEKPVELRTLRGRRIAGFSVSGVWCAKQVASFDANGKLLWESPEAEPGYPSPLSAVPSNPARYCH
jgi:hypothetical protein